LFEALSENFSHDFVRFLVFWRRRIYGGGSGEDIGKILAFPSDRDFGAPVFRKTGKGYCLLLVIFGTIKARLFQTADS
jgi:hypothetical protein